MKKFQLLILLLLFCSCGKKTEVQVDNSRTQLDKTEKYISPSAQITDVTKDVSVQLKKIDKSYKVDYAKIDGYEALTVDLFLDPMTVGMMSAMTGNGNIYEYYGFDAIYQFVRPLFKKYSDAKKIYVNLIHYSEKRDKYGNVTKNERENYFTGSLKRETAEKINWDFFKTEKAGLMLGLDSKKLYAMLDK